MSGTGVRWLANSDAYAAAALRASLPYSHCALVSSKRVCAQVEIHCRVLRALAQVLAPHQFHKLTISMLRVDRCMIRFDYHCHCARCQTNLIACYVPAPHLSRAASHFFSVVLNKPRRRERGGKGKTGGPVKPYRSSACVLVSCVGGANRPLQVNHFAQGEQVIQQVVYGQSVQKGQYGVALRDTALHQQIQQHARCIHQHNIARGIPVWRYRLCPDSVRSAVFRFCITRPYQINRAPQACWIKQQHIRSSEDYQDARGGSLL